MARARKSHDTGKEEVKSGAKLEPAYSSNGRDPLVVYADLQREGDPYARVLILKFQAKYAARYFIDLLVHNDTWEWIDPIGAREALKTTGGVRISMFKDDLNKLMAYKMSEAERSWEDEQVKQHTLRFKYGTHEAAKKDDNEEHSHGSDETLSDGGTKTPKSKRGSTRTPKEPKVKVDKSGFISAIELAADSKLEGREVRGILRSSGLTKPDIGWMWPKGSNELKEAKKIIDAGIKALLKKKGKK